MEYAVHLEKNKSEDERSANLQVTKLKPCDPEFKSNVMQQKPAPLNPQVRVSSVPERRAECIPAKVNPTTSKVIPQIRCPTKSEKKTEEIVKHNPFRTAKEQLVNIS